MTNELRQNLIKLIVKREKLRPLGRIPRLFRDSLRAIPYYTLATLSHIKPYKISFKTLWGDKMTGYLPEANTFYYYGNCEANLTSFLLRFITDNMTFIDVGAHIGFYSMLSSHLVGQKGKVYSFEPTPWTYQLLEKNTSNLSNVHATNAGVSDTESSISFFDYGPGYGAYNTASKKGTMLKSIPKEITVKTIQLDIFCKENKIIPDFIKLDAEGFEYNILLGMKEILSTNRPLITLEMAGGDEWSENRKLSSGILLTANYGPFEMTNDGYLKACNIQSSYTYDNILFVPNEKFNLIKNLIKTP